MTALMVPSSRFTRSSTSRTMRPVSTSSAPVGSSHSSTSGRLAIARLHRVVGDVRHQRDAFRRGEARDQVAELEDEADVLAPEVRELLVAPLGQGVIEVVHLARGGRVEPAEQVEERRLAAPRRDQQHHELARVELQRHLAQRDHLHVSHVLDLGDVAHAQDWFGHIDASLSGDESSMRSAHGRPADVDQAPSVRRAVPRRRTSIPSRRGAPDAGTQRRDDEAAAGQAPVHLGHDRLHRRAGRIEGRGTRGELEGNADARAIDPRHGYPMAARTSRPSRASMGTGPSIARNATPCARRAAPSTTAWS